MITKKPRFTHYSYTIRPDSKREPTGMYDLSLEDTTHRRDMIQRFQANGEFLAILPYANEVQTMNDLRHILMWLDTNKKKNDDNVHQD